MRREREVSQTFVALADTLVNDFDVLDFLHVLCRHCVRLLEVDAVGVLLVDSAEELRVLAASDEQAHLLELFEVQNEEGPCLECFRSGAPTFEEDLGTSERWPLFRQQALSLGFRSVEAVPLRLRAQVVGAMNLFRTTRGQLTERDRSLAQALADVATIGLLQEQAIRESRVLAEQLQVALNNRVVIEQAKGVLAVRAAVELEVAFEMMRRYARSHNLRLPAVARDVIEGRLSTDALRDPS